MMKRVTCPHCGEENAVTITSLIPGECEEFHCCECSSSFKASQIIGMVFVGISMSHATEIDLAEEQAHFEKEENLPQIMQEENVNNLVHEIRMKSFARKGAHV